MQELSALESGSLKGRLEALLLVSSEAVPASELAGALGVPERDAQETLAALSQEYATCDRGFQLREVAGGWRLFTHPAYHDLVASYVVSWDRRRLSQASLETLAVIAYHQPVTRDGVRAVRGVNSDGVIGSLKAKGLVREVGRDERNAVLFGTTKAFLEGFGLSSLDDLPPLEDFAPDEESRRFIRDRLSGGGVGPAPEDAADGDRDLIEDGEADDG